MLHDVEARIAASSVADVADELGVTTIAVQAALRRQGGQSAHRYGGKTPMTQPNESTLHDAWETEQTIKGLARRFAVSMNTVAIWLAQIAIFVNDTPANSRGDLERAIRASDSIDVIRRRHRVTDRTVVVELHCHGLFDDHRLRHMKRQQVGIVHRAVVVHNSCTIARDTA